MTAVDRRAFLGVTVGAAVLTGVVGAFFTRWGGGAPPESAWVTPTVGLFDGGGSVGARGRF